MISDLEILDLGISPGSRVVSQITKSEITKSRIRWVILASVDAISKSRPSGAFNAKGASYRLGRAHCAWSTNERARSEAVILDWTGTVVD